MLKAKLLAGGGAETIYTDDVFSAYTYTGNGSTQTITNGIDLAGSGGMVWIKGRSGATDHQLFDTARTATYELISNSTAAQTADADTLTAFNSNGFALGADATTNTNTATYASWTFRKAPKFFSQATATVTGGADATVSFSDLATLGMVVVKRTDSTGSWYVWHRSLTAGKLLYLEQTAAEATLGHITVSGTTVTLEGGVIANGTYIVYAWAHDTATDGLIQCGSFTTDGSGNATVTLGWEPQYLMLKASSTAGNWNIVDATRGMTVGASPGTADDPFVKANLTDAEALGGLCAPTPTGFLTTVGVSTTYIYLAIRRPNKPPTVGTQVYQAIARTGTGAAATVTGVGFAPDLVMPFNRSGVAGMGHPVYDRLRGALKSLRANITNTEYTDTASLTEFGVDGITVGADGGEYINSSRESSIINHFFKRAVGVFDEVCYTGTGVAKTEAHNLGVAPELWIVKGRSGATGWRVGCTSLANTECLVLETTAAKTTDATSWNSTFPTSSVFSLGTQANVNTNTATYIAYLFATKAGISKVGSYTGNGSSLTLNMGFTTGARFFMCKRTDSTGDWYVFDTTRGIIAGNDGHLSLNTTAAEVTTDDSVDPDTSGLIVNQVAATNINVNAATYIYLAFA